MERRARKGFGRLETERARPGLPPGDGPPAASVRGILLAERRIHRALAGAARNLGRIAAAFAAAIERGGRVIYAGAGTSGRLGALDAAEIPPTFGLAPSRVRAVLAGGGRAMRHAVEDAEDDADAGARAISRAGTGRADLVIGISASGRTPFVEGALAAARRLGADTALIACVRRPALSRRARVTAAIPVGPEVLAGSTRMGAGTATKIALHAISTAAMAAIGRIYRGEMIGVRATNEKLRARASRIVSRLAVVPPARARRLLAAVRGRVPEAILMGRFGIGPREAARRLSDAGTLAQALADGSGIG